MNDWLYPLLILASSLAFGIMVLCFKRIHDTPRMRLLFFMVSASFIYTFGYSQEFLQRTLEGVLFWIRIQYAGISFLPVLMLFIAIHTLNYREDVALPRLLYLFLLPGFITFISVLVFTVPYFYNEISFIITGRFTHVIVKGASLYIFFIIQVICFTVFVIFLYIKALIQQSGNRNMVLGLLFAALLPALSFVLYICRVFPYGVDPVPISMVLVGPVYYVLIYSEKLINDINSAKARYFQATLSPVMIFNNADELIDINPPALFLLSTEKSQVVGMKWKEICNDYGLDDSLLQVQANNCETSIENRVYNFVHAAYLNKKGDARGYIRSFYDITESKKAFEDLEKEASLDPLTSLLNRGKWEERVLHQVKQGRRFRQPGSLLLIDLDHFKLINDSFGHQAGDEVLRRVSELLKVQVREIDLCGRYGGEELAIWLTQTESSSAMIVAERIRCALKALRIMYNAREVPVTASIGVYGQDVLKNTEVSDFVIKADKALYEAKKDGRNRVVGYGLS